MGFSTLSVPGKVVNRYNNQLNSSVGTYLYWRRMYEAMVYWAEPRSVRTRIQRESDPDLVWRLKRATPAPTSPSMCPGSPSTP